MVIRVGLVGTGYAARTRAAAFGEDERSHVISVAGRDTERTAAFATQHGFVAASSWRSLVEDDAIDLVVVATVSALHGDIAEAALAAGKHVVVEYPLSLDLAQAKRLLVLATQQKRLLHVEHIELLGGLHQAMKRYLPEVGEPHYVSYRTLNPQRPALKKWTYRLDLFGFPFCGALSRVHRMTNLFGDVTTVDCVAQVCGDRAMQDGNREDDSGEDYFKTILCSGRLRFASGVIAELTYGKGEQLWMARRDVEVQGSLGALYFGRNEGFLTTAAGTRSIAVTPRRGLFVKDTAAVLAYLTEGIPLYVTAQESVYALGVGDAMRRASECGQSVRLLAN